MPNDTKLKTNRIELKVSEAAYNEISTAMMNAGEKLSPNSEIILTKDIMIKNPLDPRRMAIRKDAAEIAVKIFHSYDADGNLSHEGFLTVVHQIEEFIATGTLPSTKEAAKGWK